MKKSNELLYCELISNNVAQWENIIEAIELLEGHKNINWWEEYKKGTLKNCEGETRGNMLLYYDFKKPEDTFCVDLYTVHILNKNEIEKEFKDLRKIKCRL